MCVLVKNCDENNQHIKHGRVICRSHSICRQDICPICCYFFLVRIVCTISSRNPSCPVICMVVKFSLPGSCEFGHVELLTCLDTCHLTTIKMDPREYVLVCFTRIFAHYQGCVFVLPDSWPNGK